MGQSLLPPLKAHADAWLTRAWLLLRTIVHPAQVGARGAAPLGVQ
jgi:hypothetical protein